MHSILQTKSSNISKDFSQCSLVDVIKVISREKYYLSLNTKCVKRSINGLEKDKVADVSEKYWTFCENGWNPNTSLKFQLIGLDI